VILVLPWPSIKYLTGFAYVTPNMLPCQTHIIEQLNYIFGSSLLWYQN